LTALIYAMRRSRVEVNQEGYGEVAFEALYKCLLTARDLAVKLKDEYGCKVSEKLELLQVEVVPSARVREMLESL